MGMKNTDDERKIHQEHEFRKWADKRPERRNTEDGRFPWTEEDHSRYYEEIEKWLDDQPSRSNPYENDHR